MVDNLLLLIDEALGLVKELKFQVSSRRRTEELCGLEPEEKQAGLA